MISFFYYPPVRKRLLTGTGVLILGSLAVAGAIGLAAILIAVFS